MLFRSTQNTRAKRTGFVRLPPPFSLTSSFLLNTTDSCDGGHARRISFATTMFVIRIIGVVAERALLQVQAPVLNTMKRPEGCNQKFRDPRPRRILASARVPDVQWSSRVRAKDILEHPRHHKVSMKKKGRGLGERSK